MSPEVLAALRASGPLPLDDSFRWSIPGTFPWRRHKIEVRMGESCAFAMFSQAPRGSKTKPKSVEIWAAMEGALTTSGFVDVDRDRLRGVIESAPSDLGIILGVHVAADTTLSVLQAPVRRVGVTAPLDYVKDPPAPALLWLGDGWAILEAPTRAPGDCSWMEAP
jgi:hypothetical protein